MRSSRVFTRDIGWIGVIGVAFGIFLLVWANDYTSSRLAYTPTPTPFSAFAAFTPTLQPSQTPTSVPTTPPTAERKENSEHREKRAKYHDTLAAIYSYVKEWRKAGDHKVPAKRPTLQIRHWTLLGEMTRNVLGIPFGDYEK